MASLSVYVSTYGVRLFATFASLLTSVILARGLGPAGRGDVTAFIAGISLLVQFSGFGLSSSSVVELGERPDRVREVGAVLFGATLVVLPLAALSAVLLGEFGGAAFPPVLIALAVGWPVAQLLGLNVQAAFLGLGQYRWFNGLELASRGLSLVAIAALFLVTAPSAVQVLTVLFAAETTVVAVGVGMFLRRHGWCRRPAPELTRRMVLAGLRAYLTLMPAYVIVRSDVLLVRGWRGAAETGVYAVAAQVVTLLWMLPQVAGQVLFSDITRSTERAAATARVTGATFWLLLAACVVAAALGYPAITLVFGARFAGAYPLLLLLLPGALALGVEITVVQYFNAHGFPVIIFKYWLWAVGVNLLINVLAIPSMGATAAAVSSSVSYALVAVLVVRLFVRESGLSLVDLVRMPRRTAAVAQP
jgi:Membrane protein involved in the export of O-antigen and teichoic acid